MPVLKSDGAGRAGKRPPRRPQPKPTAQLAPPSPLRLPTPKRQSKQPQRPAPAPQRRTPGVSVQPSAKTYRKQYREATPKGRKIMRSAPGRMGETTNDLHKRWLKFETLADRGAEIQKLDKAGRFKPDTSKEAAEANKALNAYGLRRAKLETKRELVAALSGAPQAKKLRKVHKGGATSSAFAPRMNLSGFFGSGGPGSDDVASNVGKQAAAVSKATWENPRAVASKTVKAVPETLKAIPSGAVNAVIHPGKTASATVQDYKRRYSGSVKDRAERIKKEGALPELADAGIIATGVGAPVGRATVGAAKTGAFGARGVRWATAERPALRTSGGTVRMQAKADRPVRLTVQRARDANRAKADRRAVERADQRGVGADPLRVVAAATKGAEVTPRFRASKIQRKMVAGTKGGQLFLMKAEQQRAVDQVGRKQINRLSKAERKAFYYVASGVIAADAKRAVPQLKKLEADIKQYRADRGVAAPSGLLKSNDQLPDIRWLIEHADEAFTPRVADTVRNLRRQDVQVAAADPKLREDGAPSQEQIFTRRLAQQAERLGVRRGERPDGMYDPSETVAQWARRVRKAGDAAGLERPLYFPSEKYGLSQAFSDRAIGGTKATPKTYKYTGKLFRAGTQNTDPEVYLSGLARSIKRKHNWNLIAEQLDKHAFKDLEGLKLGALREQLHRLNMNERDVAFWNPELYRRALEDDTRRGNLEAADATEAGRMGVEFGAEKVAAAFRQATGESAADIPTELANRSGWTAVPRAVYDEIHAGAVPGRFAAAGRSWDIGKGKISRYMLGLNPVWLQFQVAANALQAGVPSGGEALLDLASGASRKWWNDLDPDTQARLSAKIGVGAGADADTPRMGAAANNAFINGYRDFKAHPMFDKPLVGKGPSIKQLNPVEWVLGADRVQNDAFRRSMLYTSAKRAAVKRMGENMSGAERAQARIISLLKRPPAEQFKLGPEDVAAIEQHAKYVNDWLGDYTNYTHFERKGLKRFVMFYGFLRFSTRLVFYTMPVEHPMASLIAAKLGQLQAEEVKDLLGGDAMPWAFGKVYFDDDGKLKEIDLAKLNPAVSQITGADKLSQAGSVLPPFAVMAAEQLVHRNLFSDKEWRVKGKAAKYGADGSDYGIGTRLRIAADDLAGTLFPYRTAEKLTQSGPQGDDSLLFSPRPVTHKTEEIKQQDRKKLAFEAANESLLNELVAALPRPSRDKDAAKEQRAFETKTKKAKSKPKGYGSGGYGSGGYGSGYGKQYGG